MVNSTDDVRIEGLRPLLPPAILMEELPVSELMAQRVESARAAAARIVTGEDDRLLVVVGPCSIHDPVAAIEYAQRLLPLERSLSGSLQLVMRSYFEKPRTTVGWKGLINDPYLDGSFAINHGLRVARGLLRELVSLGLPTATEFLDPISPQFVADLVAWGAIGARTTESQVHRELASGLSMPVGFKNGTGGALQVAIDAVRSARAPHHFLSVTKQGLAAIVTTRGNEQGHVILRGGIDGPNHDASSVAQAAAALSAAGLPPVVMVDCSHANSGKEPARQREVALELAQRIAAGERTLMGVMLESFLVAGRQELNPGGSLTFGQSVTDACLGWSETEDLLQQLAESVEARRSHR